MNRKNKNKNLKPIVVIEKIVEFYKFNWKIFLIFFRNFSQCRFFYHTFLTPYSSHSCNFIKLAFTYTEKMKVQYIGLIIFIRSVMKKSWMRGSQNKNIFNIFLWFSTEILFGRIKYYTIVYWYWQFHKIGIYLHWENESSVHWVDNFHKECNEKIMNEGVAEQKYF